MTTDTSPDPSTENRLFEADVARLLHMMVHSVYSDKNVFLRELVSNAADACEKLRYEAITKPGLLADQSDSQITITIDEESRRLGVEDNGIGMSREELVEALGTIARSGTRAFMERLHATKSGENAQLIGQFGVGFYSCFMVADRVDVVSRRAGSQEAWLWSSDGQGSYSIRAVNPSEAPQRGTRVTLKLMEDAATYASRFTIERIVKQQSGHVPVPISLIGKPDTEPARLTDGSALWTKSKADVTAEDYADFYRSISSQYDEPALTVHFRAEGRQEYTTLAFIPGSQPFDMGDPDRKGRMKLYVKRVFITDDAELMPRYLRFVRGLIDTADLPLNVSREMIQDSPILSSIRKGVTSRVVSAIEKLAETDPDSFLKLWSNFGAVLKEGIYEDFEKRVQLLNLARFRTSTSGNDYRSLSDYVKSAHDGQEAIYYLAGHNLDQLKASPQLEGFRARGIEVLLLSDAIDSFWVMNAPEFEGKPFKSVTQGAADLSQFSKPDATAAATADAQPDLDDLLAYARAELAAQVSDVRLSERLTESAVCLIAADGSYDRQLEKILQSAGQIEDGSKPVLEINPHHMMIQSIVKMEDLTFRQDAVLMLLDQARILDGDKPADPRAFAERLQRVFERAAKA